MIEVRTDKPVALDSPDHMHPWGTKHDNSTNYRFNEKVFHLFGGRPLKVLDLGCSGGGYVKSMVDDGHNAIGVEGSDYSRRMRRAEWRTIPERLFTADVTAPFDVLEDGQMMKFDLITAWELMEHLTESDIPQFCRNILKHLAVGGLFIASINTKPDRDLHQTVKPREWWLSLLAQQDLQNRPEIVEWFHEQFIRGKRFHAPDAIHVALTRRGDTSPIPLPRVSINERLFDIWHFSKPHRYLRALVVGKKHFH